jgi:hypothetical protein
LDDLRIRLQPKQSVLADLWNDPRYTRLGSGGARGGSKSGGGRRINILRRLEFPNTTGLILRRSLKELEQSHIQKMFEEFPGLQSNYVDHKKKLVFPETNSTLYFGSAPTAKDVADFASSEYADILVDEAQEFSQDELERLSGSCRCTTNSSITPKMVYTFMPGASPTGLPPRGLNYLKRVFIDGQLKDEETRHQWAFVQAFAWDNIEWARSELTRDGIGEGEHRPGKNDCECQECVFYSWPEETRREYFLTRTDYVGKTLGSITDPFLRDAWLYGKWGVFQGQYFTNFSEARHVIDLYDGQRRSIPRPWTPQQLGIKPWYKKWMSGDWGNPHPTVIYWHAQDERGKVITYRELWVREMGEAELGKEITERSAGEKLDCFPFSWDAFGKLNKFTRKSITEMIGAAMGKEVPKPISAGNDAGSRISGWRLMHQMLEHDDWLISRDCNHLIECLPSLMRDDKNPADVLKVDYTENNIGDDPADSARYGLQYMMGASYKPAQVRLEETLAKLPIEGADRYIAHLQFNKKEKEAGGAVFYPQRRKARRH